MPSQDEFLSQLRDALNHLYDYHYLENHPLALRYWPEAIQGSPSRAERFSRLLLESIEELSPLDAPTKDTSPARFCLLLVYRYVEEWPLSDIMHELGCSRSHLFREQRNAIVMLASVLRRKLPQQISALTDQGDMLQAEAGRVLAQREAVNPAEVVQGVLKVLGNLAGQHSVTLVCDLDPGLPSIYSSRTLLRQVLLKGLSDLISQPITRQVCVRMCRARQGLSTELITKFSALGHRSDSTGRRQIPDLDSVRRLVEMMGGQWREVEVRPDGYVCRFDFPVDSEKVLLAIEDNEGIIRVFQGYLAGHNYLVIGATTGDEALQLAREVRPTAITLDIMMPTQDGWEILQTLKNDPVTQHIPVVVCSVLDDPKLALSLGAVAYLRKPITQTDLLTVLDSLPGTP
jgi:CheY-like chemotaxis protein